ncbi:MAG: hypothetical protein PHC52_13585, partial [Syntrophales bacterium]|nr:hypothetical protein [Syntrophales bacterium]
MAVEITKPNQIALNGELYTISGQITRRLVTRPRKITVGDTGWNDNQFLSTTAVSDQRGGIGCEEYLKPEHIARCWWSTFDLSHPNHMLPPPLATKIALGGAPNLWCDFNWALYLADGAVLKKLNATGDGFTTVTTCAATITGMFTAQYSGTNYLFLCCNGTYFYLVTTAEAVTLINNDGFGLACSPYRGIGWNSKTFFISSVGVIYELTAMDPSPGTTSATLTAKGAIADSLAPTGLEILPDAAGTPIIYAATAQHLWAHDYTNARWVETNVRYARDGYAGYGLIQWNTEAYLSAGLHVKKYNPMAGTSEPVGLDLDDGVPYEYQGTIMKFIDGADCFYALVDGTKAGTTFYSWVGRYDGMGWQVWWDARALSAWVSPTGFVDAGSGWTDEANAYDGDLFTLAKSANIESGHWTEWLELSHAAIICDSVKIYAAYNWFVISTRCQIDIYYGAAWHNVYDGIGPDNLYRWFVASFAEQTITAMRVRFYRDDVYPASFFNLSEAYFNQTGISNIAVGNGIVSDVFARRLWWNFGGDVYYMPLQKYNLLPKKNASYQYAPSAIHVS